VGYYYPTFPYKCRDVAVQLPVMAERLELRVPDGTNTRWKQQAEEHGLSLTEFVLRRVESDPLAGTISSEIKDDGDPYEPPCRSAGDDLPATVRCSV
jgi:hypothetical protein